MSAGAAWTDEELRGVLIAADEAIERHDNNGHAFVDGVNKLNPGPKRSLAAYMMKLSGQGEKYTVLRKNLQVIYDVQMSAKDVREAADARRLVKAHKEIARQARLKAKKEQEAKVEAQAEVHAQIARQAKGQKTKAAKPRLVTRSKPVKLANMPNDLEPPRPGEISIPEAALIIGCSEGTLRNWAQKKKIEARLVSKDPSRKYYYIYREVVESLAKSLAAPAGAKRSWLSYAPVVKRAEPYNAVKVEPAKPVKAEPAKPRLAAVPTPVIPSPTVASYNDKVAWIVDAVISGRMTRVQADSALEAINKRR